MPDQHTGSTPGQLPLNADDDTNNATQLAAQVEHLLGIVADLQRKLDHSEGEAKAGVRFDDTLMRLVSRIAMILQAEKCVFLMFNRSTAELVALPPAFGLAAQEVELFRLPASTGMSGLVILSGQPVIYNDPSDNPRSDHVLVHALGVKNGCCAPLVVQRRDLENHVVDSQTIGVVHVMNKRYGLPFSDEDLHLLERLARNAAAVITSAQMYREASEGNSELISTFESLGAGLVLVNANKHITLVNGQAESILPGLQQAALQKEDYHSALPQHELVSLFDNALTTRKEGSTELQTQEDRIFRVNVTPVKTDDGLDTAGAVAVFNDITDIRMIDRMKSRFVSTVSHELRTPLTSIKGFVSTLLGDSEGYYDEAARREFLGIIDQETDRLRRLIDDLLSMSRVEAGRSLDMHLQWINIIPVLQQVVAVQQAGTHQHQIELQVPDEMPQVYADSDKLEQILYNLISNAVKYQPDGGPVRVTLSLEASSGSYRIDVVDQGVGIPPDQLPLIFDRFHRVESSQNVQISGTGIGLFLVKHLTASHGGDVSVSSTPGEGSCFTVRMPLRAVLSPVDTSSL